MHCCLAPSLGWNYRPASRLEHTALGSPALLLSHRSHLIGNIYEQEANRMRERLQEPPSLKRLIWLFQETIKPQQLLFSTQHLNWRAYSKTEKLTIEKPHQFRNSSTSNSSLSTWRGMAFEMFPLSCVCPCKISITSSALQWCSRSPLKLHKQEVKIKSKYMPLNEFEMFSCTF